MARIDCLGAGLVGSFVAMKLIELGHNVNVLDPNPSKYLRGHSNLRVQKIDAMEYCMDFENLRGADIVINLLPGDIGSDVTEKLCENSIKIVDLSFCEDTPDINVGKCTENEATILWDVGIAPGLSNMLLSEASRLTGELEFGEVRVGGNPSVKDGSWDYMAPFSPIDVIAEYTRPARVVRDYNSEILPALSERHIIDVAGKGDMEAFLTDGLRSVLYSIPAKELSEYTVRWPGHIQRFIDQRKADSLDIDKLLEEWKFDDEIPNFTWMQVKTKSMEGACMEWIVLDEGDEEWHSMARCTGLVTVCAVSEWLDDPEMLPAGVHAPESLSSEVISRVLDRMIEEGVSIHQIHSSSNDD